MKKVIGKNIVIKNVEEEVRSDAGFILSADDVKGFRYKRGVVVMPGNDVSTIKAGDEIYYDKSNSYTMMINDEDVTIIAERDVVIVL
jgi:co-chaperonin GroES (HSP10)